MIVDCAGEKNYLVFADFFALLTSLNIVFQ